MRRIFRPMSKKKQKTKKGNGLKFIIFILTIGVILGVGYYYSYSSKKMEIWIKEKDTPIVKHLNKAADLFQSQQYIPAEREFQEAYKLSKQADIESSTLWKERMENIAPPRKFYTGDPANRSSGGSIYFKNRMIEAIFGYSSSVYWRVTAQYANKKSQVSIDGTSKFRIPESEFKPALDAIETGMTIDPRSEILRILKAEILTDLGQYTQAISILDEVVSLINSDSADAFNLLGIIYSKPAFMDTKDYEVYREKALSMFEKASILPSSSGGRLAAPNYNLALYYSTPPANKGANALPSQNDAKKAIHYFEEYLKIAGDDTPLSNNAKEEIERLKRIAP